MSYFNDLVRFINSDRYQYTESAVLLEMGKQSEWAVFEFFFRKTEDGAFAVVSGIETVVNLILSINQSTKEEKYRLFQPLISEPELLDYLCEINFIGNMYAMREGELCYPNEPIIIIEAPVIIAKILETPLLNAMNFQLAIASKASRVSRAAGSTPVLAFGPRRAHGFDGAVLGTKAALIGGCAAHSSMALESIYHIASVGTMSHSFIQSFGVGCTAEREAFNAFISSRKNHKAQSLLLLIDTYNTINCGLPNAIAAFKAGNIDNNYPSSFGIRIDSGDLAYLSKLCRRALDAAGLTKAVITLTNGLDEYSIRALREQEAKFDIIGVGDAIAVSRDNPCFGGVYKLVKMNNNPVIKLSEDNLKCSTPGHKEIYRIYQNGEAKADLITLKDDGDKDKLLNQEEITIQSEFNQLAKTTFKANSYNIRRLLMPMILNGQLTDEATLLINIERSRLFYHTNLAALPDECKRLLNPHQYKVDLSSDLMKLKSAMILAAQSI